MKLRFQFYLSGTDDRGGVQKKKIRVFKSLYCNYFGTLMSPPRDNLPKFSVTAGEASSNLSGQPSKQLKALNPPSRGRKHLGSTPETVCIFNALLFH